MRARIGCAAAVLVLAGCATREVQFHHWPAETPAANNKADIARMQGLQAAAAAAATLATPQASDQPVGAAQPPPPPVKPGDAPSLKTYDPWARLNRFTYRFNARFDEALSASIDRPGLRLSLMVGSRLSRRVCAEWPRWSPAGSNRWRCSTQ